MLSLSVNVLFVERYYIHEQTKILNQVSKEIKQSPLSQMEDTFENLEQQYGLAIVYTKSSQELDQINEDLIWQFEKKKIKLNKFWLTKETLQQLSERTITRKYDQGISQYKVLTAFQEADGYIFAIGLPMPKMDETIKTVNQFNLGLTTISAILIVILVWLLSKKITKPLEELKVLSEDIAHLKFRKQKIKTNDEIEDLANSINKMSEALEEAHHEITTQNVRLKELLANVSHELKTPLALIKIYEQGIVDGLDDGTYRDTIHEQVDKMNYLIEKLLLWAEIENKTLVKTEVDLKQELDLILKQFKLVLKTRDIKINLNVEQSAEYIIAADLESIKIVLENLLTNAIKYTTNQLIEIQLSHEADHLTLIMANGVSGLDETMLDEMWRPFYVLEKSRNKELSGTGLGLPIIKDILEQHGFHFVTKLEDNKILFIVTFL